MAQEIMKGLFGLDAPIQEPQRAAGLEGVLQRLETGASAGIRRGFGQKTALEVQQDKIKNIIQGVSKAGIDVGTSKGMNLLGEQLINQGLEGIGISLKIKAQNMSLSEAQILSELEDAKAKRAGFGKTPVTAQIQRIVGSLKDEQGKPYQLQPFIEDYPPVVLDVVNEKIKQEKAFAAESRIERQKELEAEETELRAEGSIERAKSVLAEIQGARQLIVDAKDDLIGVTGYAGILANLPQTNARKLAGYIDTIKARLGFDELAKMREESKTGGALGQVAVKELDFLQGSVTKLDQLQSEKDLLNALNKIEMHYNKLLRTKEDIIAERRGGIKSTDVKTVDITDNKYLQGFNNKDKEIIQKTFLRNRSKYPGVTEAELYDEVIKALRRKNKIGQ